MRIIVFLFLIHLLSIRSISQSKFENALAENIEIFSKENLDFCQAPFCRPVFSQDNKTIAYLKSENTSYIDYIDKKNRHNIVIKNIGSSAAATTIPVGSTTRSGALAWSLDGKRLYYINSKNSFVYNIETKKTTRFAIDYLGADNEGLDKCFFYNETTICYFPHTGASNYNKLVVLINLDNLALQYYQNNNPNHVEFISSLQEQYKILSENSEHQNFTLSVNPKGKYLFKNEPLILRNKKGHYGKQILDNISPEKIVISKNLNHFVTWGYDRYLVYTLGVKQNFKKINFTVPLEKESLLSQELRLKYDNLFNNGVPIWGHVYRAKTNPLNNKVIGADKSIYKGMVLFIMKGESVASVTTYLEIKQMLEGDVVTEIFSNDDPSTGESIKDLGIWTTLGEYTKEGQNYATYYVPTGKEAKETLSEIEISSDKKENNDSKDIIYNKVDFEAAYPGNDTAWFSFLKKNLDESVPARQGATDGNYTVVVGFVVDKNGDLSNFKALTNHGYGMENEAIRTLKKSSKWIPATIDGKNVSSHRVQPITFTVGK